MKFSNFILITLFGISISISACHGNKGVADAQEIASNGVIDSLGIDTTHHFICPNRCKGSGGPIQDICPVCGTEYVHNDAFHTVHPNVPEPEIRIDPVTHAAVPTHTEAQNARGVYHFICPNGHPGGAGMPGKCPKCGADLVHNRAFHDN